MPLSGARLITCHAPAGAPTGPGVVITHPYTDAIDTNTLINTAFTAAPRRLLPWRVVFPDGSTTVMDASSLTNAMLTAQELMPGFARIERVGDW